MRKKNNEMRGDLIVKSCKIKPINSSKKYYVNLTDEYPILFIIAALTEGVSVFKGIDDLKNKERVIGSKKCKKTECCVSLVLQKRKVLIYLFRSTLASNFYMWKISESIFLSF